MDPRAVIALADRLAQADLWPGFDSRSVPVAIYQGDQTLLFRHPSPPEAFQPVAGYPGATVFVGRHPAVTANSSAEIGGVVTATLMPARPGESALSRAGTLIHEAFHVFQRQHHRSWTANEADLFTYPTDEPKGVALRALEVEALRRALSSNGAVSQCWTREASRLREQRYRVFAKEAIAYERGTELNEGLANYVQRKAMGTRQDEVLPELGFPAEAVRQRAYGTGAALALLLDRASPGWQALLERNDSIPLDSLLRGVLPGTEGSCGFNTEEVDRANRNATAEVAAMRARRSERRSAFLAAPGWTVVLESSAAPFFPQGFDPLNVDLIGPGETLHTRYLKLAGSAGQLEILGRSVLTEAVGPHPLFNGVRKITVTGLPEDPTVKAVEGGVTLRGEGITGVVRVVRIERSGQTIELVLAPSP